MSKSTAWLENLGGTVKPATMADLNRMLEGFSLSLDQPRDGRFSLAEKSGRSAIADANKSIDDLMAVLRGGHRSSSVKSLQAMNRELSEFSLSAPGLELKRTASGTEVSGYAAVFGNVDSDGEVIDPGAFDASLAQYRRKGSWPLMFWSHDQAEVIGYWTNFYADEKGLVAVGRILSSVQRGKEALALLDAGAISGLSIGFKCRRDKMVSGVRHLQQLELVEVSVVACPSNDASRLSIVGKEM